MSYGFEYGAGGGGYGGGGFDNFGGGGGGLGFGDMGGGFMGNAEEPKKSGEKKSRDRQNFMAVTLKQLRGSKGSDDVFRVDDVEVHTVKLIGRISSFSDESTNYSFKLNDGTSEMDCKKWKDTDAPSIFSSLQEGQTVRVVGTIREFANNSHLLVYSVSPIVDWNEVTHHFLDVIFTHLQNTRGKIPSSAAPTSHGPASFGTPARGHGQNLNNAMKRESGLDEEVFDAYRDGGMRPEGMHYREVLQNLQSKGVNITKEQLMGVVFQLCNDGRLYTTIDDEHFRPTDC